MRPAKCPGCGTSIRLGGGRGRQRLVLAFVVAPVSVLVCLAVLYQAFRLGMPSGDSVVARLGALAICLPGFLILPAVLAVRLLGVVRA